MLFVPFLMPDEPLTSLHIFFFRRHKHSPPQRLLLRNVHDMVVVFAANVIESESSMKKEAFLEFEKLYVSDGEGWWSSVVAAVTETSRWQFFSDESMLNVAHGNLNFSGAFNSLGGSGR